MPPLALHVRSGSGEMADTPVLGTGAPACGFKSRLPHNIFTTLGRIFRDIF
jgi:hypothetical protein